MWDLSGEESVQYFLLKSWPVNEVVYPRQRRNIKENAI